MAAPKRENPPSKHPGRNGRERELEEAEGERQQKDGDQKRQAGEEVEDVRERIRQSQPRQVR
jgi:hypothetical protein